MQAYERSFEENEDLGLNDMRTEGASHSSQDADCLRVAAFHSRAIATFFFIPTFVLIISRAAIAFFIFVEQATTQSSRRTCTRKRRRRGVVVGIDYLYPPGAQVRK